MSHLPPQAITEFQALYKKHLGHELPPEQVSTRANEVFAVLRLLLEQPQQPTKQVPKSPERNDTEPSFQHSQ